MKSQNKPPQTRAEREYVSLVKSLPCSVCGEPGPSEVHEPKQGAWWLSVALCSDCHRGNRNGWHGQRWMWTVKKMDELDALAVTVRRIVWRLTEKSA